MVNMTLAIPNELHKKMKKHNEVKWSEVARNGINKHVDMLEMMDKILEKSTLTEKDALEIGRKINKGIAKRHGLIK